MSILPKPILCGYNELRGWEDDDLSAALSVFRVTCDQLQSEDWAEIRAKAPGATDAKAFFESHFLPVLFGATDPALFTGYFEPELDASRTRAPGFETPLYRLPENLPKDQPWKTRAEIFGGALDDQGLELAWAADPVEAFFLQVQGSGRLRLQDGSVMRVGYAGKNGHDYSSVGQELVRRGLFEAGKVTAQGISNWVNHNPIEGLALLNHNRSYVFFREITEIPADMGPLGTMNRSVTAERSIAVDPDFTPLGAPVWIEKLDPHSMHRLMIAQDTGSAIKGPQRADIFFGTGVEAGLRAGQVTESGRMVTLLPTELALRITGGT